MFEKKRIKVLARKADRSNISQGCFLLTEENGVCLSSSMEIIISFKKLKEKKIVLLFCIEFV